MESDPEPTPMDREAFTAALRGVKEALWERSLADALSLCIIVMAQYLAATGASPEALQPMIGNISIQLTNAVAEACRQVESRQAPHPAEGQQFNA